MSRNPLPCPASHKTINIDQPTLDQIPSLTSITITSPSPIPHKLAQIIHSLHSRKSQLHTLLSSQPTPTPQCCQSRAYILTPVSDMNRLVCEQRRKLDRYREKIRVQEREIQVIRSGGVGIRDQYAGFVGELEGLEVGLRGVGDRIGEEYRKMLCIEGLGSSINSNNITDNYYHEYRKIWLQLINCQPQLAGTSLQIRKILCKLYSQLTDLQKLQNMTHITHINNQESNSRLLNQSQDQSCLQQGGSLQEQQKQYKYCNQIENVRKLSINIDIIGYIVQMKLVNRLYGIVLKIYKQQNSPSTTHNPQQAQHSQLDQTNQTNARPHNPEPTSNPEHPPLHHAYKIWLNLLKHLKQLQKHQPLLSPDSRPLSVQQFYANTVRPLIQQSIRIKRQIVRVKGRISDGGYGERLGEWEREIGMKMEFVDGLKGKVQAIERQIARLEVDSIQDANCIKQNSTSCHCVCPSCQQTQQQQQQYSKQLKQIQQAIRYFTIKAKSYELDKMTYKQTKDTIQSGKHLSPGQQQNINRYNIKNHDQTSSNISMLQSFSYLSPHKPQSPRYRRQLNRHIHTSPSHQATHKTNKKTKHTTHTHTNTHNSRKKYALHYMLSPYRNQSMATDCAVKKTNGNSQSYNNFDHLYTHCYYCQSNSQQGREKYQVGTLNKRLAWK